MMTQVAAAVTAAFACSAVLAQEATQPMQTVTITGSNLKRTDKEGTAPVSVMTAQEIKDTGVATVEELIKLVPSMGSDINQDNTSGTGFAKGVATASLRGLGSSSTLVLLNGRRITPAPYADPNNGNSVLYDLNSIPVSAIERVEILQDGASAIYGSDAIGGVINFILKKNYNGADLSVRDSMNDHGLFKRKGVSGSFGHGNLDTDGYTIAMSADLNKRDRVALGDVTDIEYQQYQAMNGRFVVPNYFHSTGDYISGSPVVFKESKPGSKNFGVSLNPASSVYAGNNMVPTLNCPSGQQITGGAANGVLPTSAYYGRTYCTFPAYQYSEAQGASKDANFLTHGELKLGGEMVGFADVQFSRAQRDYTGAPISIGTTSVTTFTSSGVGTPFQAILPIGHPDNPFTDARASVSYRFTNLRGGSQNINTGYRTLAGVRGSNAGWDWESALLWNRTNQDATYYDRLYLPTLNKLNTGTSLAQLNADPTLGHDSLTKNMSQIAQWDAKASREFGHLPGGAIGVAVGGEVRRETIALRPDPVVAAGNIFGLSNTILDNSRDVKSAFAEFRTPVLKSLEFDFAGRYDKYPTLKGNFVPKAGFKWTLSDKFAVRGTYAEGFRAPSLGQTTAGGAQYFLSGVWDPKRCEADGATPKPGGATTQDCARSIAGTGGFNPDLKPETSKSWNLGFIFSPTSAFDFTVDFYRVAQKDQIVLGTASQALKLEDKFPQNVSRNTDPASFLLDANGKPIPGTGPLLMVATPWQNMGMTEMRGADVEGHLRNKLGAWGSLSTTVRTSYTGSYKVAEYEGEPMVNVAGTAFPGITDWALGSGTPTPRWKGSVTSTWKLADNAVNMSVNYVGAASYLIKYDVDHSAFAQPFCAYGAKNANDPAPYRNTSNSLYDTYYPSCSVKEWITVGLGYTYTGFKHWTLNANIQNLFDNPAPYAPDYGTTGWNQSLHNGYGRYFTVRAAYSF
jgi:iron complex outermembrane receptor protein